MSSWIDDAACRNMPKDLFFPEPGENSVLARAICRSCSVQMQCLTFALQTGQTHGIWGGTSERERRRIKQLRRNA